MVDRGMTIDDRNRAGEVEPDVLRFDEHRIQLNVLKKKRFLIFMIWANRLLVSVSMTRVERSFLIHSTRPGMRYVGGPNTITMDQSCFFI